MSSQPSAVTFLLFFTHSQGHRMPFEIVHEDVGAIYEAQMKRSSNPRLSFDFTVYHNLTEVGKHFSLIYLTPLPIKSLLFITFSSCSVSETKFHESKHRTVKARLMVHMPMRHGCQSSPSCQDSFGLLIVRAKTRSPGNNTITSLNNIIIIIDL